jgi:hypothetical protein
VLGCSSPASTLPLTRPSIRNPPLKITFPSTVAVADQVVDPVLRLARLASKHSDFLGKIDCL